MDRILDGRERTCRGTMVGAGRVKASLKKRPEWVEEGRGQDQNEAEEPVGLGAGQTL